MAKSTSFLKTLLTLLFLGALFISQSSAQGVSLDQYANGKITSLNGDQPLASAQGWQNGNLNPNNCHLAESYSVPYRAYIIGLTGGATYTLRVGIDVKESGKIALDYFTGFQNFTPHGMFHHDPESVNPLLGIAGSGSWDRNDYLLPAPVYTNSPMPGQPTGSFNDLKNDVDGINGEPLKGEISLFNATIANVATDLVYDGTVDLTPSTVEAVLMIKFTVSGTGPQTAVIAWGGHIAAQYDWGELATPSNINGSPYHCRIKNLRDANGNIVAQGSTDRSLKASAVYRPPVCGVTGPQTACEGTSTGFTYSYTGGSSDISNYSWTLGGTDASKYRLSNTAGTVFNATTLSGATYNSVKVVPLAGETYLSAGSFTLTLTITNPGGEITCDATSGTIYAKPLQPRIQYTAPTCSQTTFSITVLCPLDGSGKDYEYSSNGGTSWQESPTFSGIAAGAGFSITVRDKGTMCVSDPTTCANYESLSACASSVTTTSDEVKEEVQRVQDVDARIVSKGLTRVLANPNPFTDKVRFTLMSDVSGMGSLEIYNTMGQKIATVYQGYVEAGRVLNKEYNVERSFRSNLIYVFRVGDQKTTGKLLNW